MLETLVRHLDMVRLTVAASAFALLGCTGLIDAPPPTKAEIARQLWVEKALPALKSIEANCITCHGGAAPRPMVEFLGGASDLEIRSTILAFDPPVLSIDAPQSSRLLTKGQHEGPPIVGQYKSDVQEWIQAEKEAAADGPDGPGTLGLRTQDFTISICTGGLPGQPTCPINELSLEDLGEGAGVPGAKLTFVAQGVGTGLYLNNLKLVPGPMGAFIEHPLFVSIPTDPMLKAIPDTFDRFFNERKNLMTAATPEEQQIGGGTAAFVNFPPQNKIAVFFKAASIFQAEGPGPGPQGGCKVPAQFEATARGPLNTNCGSCHNNLAGQPSAVSAVDMQGINQPNAMNACNQVRQRLLLNDLPNSGLFLAPALNNNNHPFRFATQAQYDAFVNAVSQWGIAERDAQ